MPGVATAIVRHGVNLLLWPLPPSRFFGFRRWALRVAGLELGPDCRWCGGGWIYGAGSVRVGQGTWLSPGVRVYTHRDAPIVIGERCDIGHGVELIPGGHEIGGPDRRAGAGFARPITIGDGSWIGAGTRILGGVRVGPGVVVAAGSVVTRDLPANTLAAGVPAVVKKALAG